METKWYHGVKWFCDWKETRDSGSRDYHAVVYDEAGKAICDTYNADDITLEPLDGDGRYWDEVGKRRMDLVAAAPETATQRDELLEALKFCKDQLETVKDGSVGGIPTSLVALIPEAIEAADAAIARAIGKSQKEEMK